MIGTLGRPETGAKEKRAGWPASGFFTVIGR